MTPARSKHRSPYLDRLRPRHEYDAPTVGLIETALFVTAAGAPRRVELVQYAAATWKARIVETRSIITIGGEQAEYVTRTHARAAVSDLSRQMGLSRLSEWHIYDPGNSVRTRQDGPPPPAPAPRTPQTHQAP